MAEFPLKGFAVVEFPCGRLALVNRAAQDRKTAAIVDSRGGTEAKIRESSGDWNALNTLFPLSPS